MERLVCQICDNQLKLKNGGIFVFLFSYDINCCNNHIQKNIDLDDLLSQKKVETFKCKEHNLNKTIHCFECDEDFCLYGLKEKDKSHKMEYKLFEFGYARLSIYKYKKKYYK